MIYLCAFNGTPKSQVNLPAPKASITYLSKKNSFSALYYWYLRGIKFFTVAGPILVRDSQIIHTNLKPQNLLLSSNEDNSTLKIADFGFASFERGNRRSSLGNLKSSLVEKLIAPTPINRNSAGYTERE